MGIRLFFLILGLLVLVSSSPKETFYQVVTSHPHDLEEILPHLETTYKNGRLWVVKLKNSAPREILKHLRPMAGGEKSYFLPAPFGQEKLGLQFKVSNDKTPKYLALIDKENLKEDVEALSRFESRYVGTPENIKAIDDLALRFKKMGYQIKKLCYVEEACNLVAEKKGKSSSVLMVMGHVDSVGESFAGADDNGSGIAVMLEMARVLKSYPNKKTIRFLITNGEEVDLLGSNYYVRVLEKEKKLKDLSLVINMDMVGYNENGIVELETSPDFESLAQWYGKLAQKYTSLRPKITTAAWGSDHVPFLDKKIPALLTMEDWETKTPCYHLECDKPETLNYDYMQEITKLNISAIIQKDLLPF